MSSLWQKSVSYTHLPLVEGEGQHFIYLLHSVVRGRLKIENHCFILVYCTSLPTNLFPSYFKRMLSWYLRFLVYNVVVGFVTIEHFTICLVNFSAYFHFIFIVLGTVSFFPVWFSTSN